MSSPNLGIVHIAANQNQPEVSANAAFDALDDAVNLALSILMTDADFTMSQAQLAAAGVITMTGALTADRHVNLPVGVNRLFIFQNSTSGGRNLIVQVAGAPGSTVTVPDAAGYVILFSDGTNVSRITQGSSASANFADAEIPAGAIDGVNRAFTLANTPNPAASLVLVQARQVLQGGGLDYTLSGASLTLISAPAIGDELQAWYRH